MTVLPLTGSYVEKVDVEGNFMAGLLRKLLSATLAALFFLISSLSFPQVALSQSQFSPNSQLSDNSIEPQQVAQESQSPKQAFPDVQGHWAQQYIEPLANLGIIVGYPDGTFQPDGAVTRAEFAAILNRAFNPPSKRPANSFVDVPENFWGFSAIRSAYQGSFLEGYPENKFQPEQNIPRVEVLVSLATGLEIQPEDLAVLSAYADASEIPDYAVPAIAAATERQMVVNYPELKQLNPNRTATRAEVAAFVYQSLVYSGKPPVSTGTGSFGTGSTTNPTQSGLPSTPSQNPQIGVVRVPQTVVPSSRGGNSNNVFIEIVGFSGIDGRSLTTGQSIEIKAKARNRQGNDLSSRTVWKDSSGKTIGSGSTLIFKATDPKIETLTATIPTDGGQTSTARVTVSVSPNDMETPSRVKVLPAEAIVEETDNQKSLITDITGIPGKICFTNDRSVWEGEMPTLRTGDVMLGASATIPPVKILEVLPPERFQSCVQVGFAKVEEFFPRSKDGQPFDIPKLIEEQLGNEARIISFNPDSRGLTPVDFSKPPALEETDWVSINPSLPSNIGRPYPGLGLPYPKGTNPRVSEVVGDNINIKYPSSKAGELANEKLGTGLELGSKKWPSYIGSCIKEEYARRYELARKKEIDKSFSQSENKTTKSQDYPFERLPSPNKIIPPEKFQIAFDLKQLLEENRNRRSPEPIRTKPEPKNPSKQFKSTAQVERKQELEFLAYLGLNVKMEVPKNGRRFNGIDWKNYESVVGFVNGDFFKFSMDAQIDETVMGGLAMDGFYDLRKTKVIPIPTGFEGPGAYRLAFSIGPIPVWIDFPFAMDLRLTAGLQAGYREGVIGFVQNGYGDFTFNGNPSGLAWITNVSNKSIVGSNFCGRSDLKGDAEVRLQPHIQVLLYSLMGPEVAIEPYTRLDANHPQAELSVVEPQKVASTTSIEIKQDEEVRLHAIAGKTIAIPITASAGVDFAMTPVVINDFIARKIPSRKVNIGKVCLPLPKPPEDRTERAVWAVATGGASELARKAPKCIGGEIDFNPNDYFRRAFTFRKNLVNKQKDVSVDIPVVEPFNRIIQGFFDYATLIWTSEKTGEAIAASNPGTTALSNLVTSPERAKPNPGSPVTLGKCALQPGLQNLRVEAFSPFDSKLKQPLGRGSVPITVQPSDSCRSSP